MQIKFNHDIIIVGVHLKTTTIITIKRVGDWIDRVFVFVRAFVREMPDELKIENEKDGSSRNGEQWEKLLGNGKTPTVVPAKLDIPLKNETKRVPSNTILGSFHKSFRLTMGSNKDDSPRHVFSRYGKHYFFCNCIFLTHLTIFKN